ncbi:MAG TPA: hypothetical protein VK116_01270, partial [Planctomycetota bacterium]|nr:hypothetical protein [Planctomycetota bacterium]
RIARVQNVETGEVIAELGPFPDPILSASIDIARDRVAVGTAGGEAHVSSLSKDAAPLHLPKHSAAISAIALSGDGEHVASGDEAGFVHIDRLSSPQGPSKVYRHLGGDVRTFAWSPDGSILASGSSDWRVYVVRPNGEQVHMLQHPSLVRSVEFHPDGSHIVSSCSDGTARIWNVATGAQVVPELRHAQAISSARFSRDGAAVVTASLDGSAVVWDSATGEQLLPAIHHRAPVIDAFIDPSATTVTTIAENGVISIATIPSGDLPMADLSLAAQLLSGTRGDPGAGVVPIVHKDFRSHWVELRNRRGELFSLDERDVLAWRLERALGDADAGAFTELVKSLEALTIANPQVIERFGYQPLLARAYGEVGRFSDAKRAFDEARRRDPSNAWLAYSQAIAALGCEDTAGYESAVRDLVALNASSSRAEALRFTAWAGALVPSSSHDLDRLERIARRAIEIAPTSPDARAALALVLCREGRFQDALVAVRESIALNENVGIALDWIVTALASLGSGELDVARERYDAARSFRDAFGPSRPPPRSAGTWDFTDW